MRFASKLDGIVFMHGSVSLERYITSCHGDEVAILGLLLVITFYHEIQALVLSWLLVSLLVFVTRNSQSNIELGNSLALC